MFVVDSYALAVVMLVVTMLCWGSWPNTQKLTRSTWRFELFYWDYVFGILICGLILAFTLGSSGTEGRGFLADLSQASGDAWTNALISGGLFNLANILFVAAIAYAGMSVAFPVGGGLALVIGVVSTYTGPPAEDPVMLFGGVGLIATAIVLSAIASRKSSGDSKKASTLGIVLSVVAGVLFGFFFRFLSDAMVSDFADPAEAGKLTSYTAVVIFGVGVLASNFVLNTILMRKPLDGPPVSFGDYFKGTGRDHGMGILGGIIWGIGLSFALISAGKADFAISWGLSQGNALVAAIWGVFIWREFRNAPKSTTPLIALMFVGYLSGLVLIILSKG